MYNETLEIILQEKRIVILKYKNLITKQVIAICLVYAPPQESDKTTFWQDFVEIIHNLHLPVIIMGDLNEI